MNEEMCDEEFNKYFEEETNKQTFNIKMEEPMKLIINYDYYFLLLKKLERLESKIKMLEKYKDDYKRMKDNFDAKVDEVEILEEEKKLPEKITINDNGTIGFPNGQWTARNMDKAFAMKINSIIDCLKSKGE